MQSVHHHIASTANLRAIHSISVEETDEILKTFGKTPVYILRQSYGAGFAPGTPGDVTLAEAFDYIDSSSLNLLARRLAHRAADELNRM
jgi:hypothetical protein